MGRAPCCSKVGLNRGPWTAREDTLLTSYIRTHGEGNWRSLPSKAGLLRCGKSCRLRWLNYLRPNIKRGNITPEEEDLILRLHSLLGNRWSLIAGRLPGRTDNEIKNYCNTRLSKRLRSRGLNPHSDKAKSIKNNNNNSRERSSNKEGRENTTPNDKTKVYVPKPRRLTSFTRNNKNTSYHNVLSESLNNDKDGGSKGFLDPPSPWAFDGGNFLNDDYDDDDVMNGCQFACETHTSSSDSMLEKVIEEYLELLNEEEGSESLFLNSFGESLGLLGPEGMIVGSP